LRNLLVSQTIYFPGGVEWDGKYLAVGDQDTSNVYQLAVINEKTMVKGTTALDDAGDVVQFWLVRDGPKTRAVRLVAPDTYNHDVELYRYPAGGRSIGTFLGVDMYEPVGAAVTPDKAL